MSYNITNCLGVIKEMFFPTPPKYTELTFTQEAYAKLMCYIHLIGDYEITGFGRVVDNKIVDIAILEQTVKSAKVDCDTEAMMKFLMSIPEEETGQWVLDWHSHVDMAVFASGTDASNYEEQWKARLHEQFPLIIVNKSQQIYSKCYISPSKATNLTIKIETQGLDKDRLIEIYNECAVNVQNLCKKQEYKITNNYQTSYLGEDYYQRYYHDDDSDGWYKNTNSNFIDLTNHKKKGLAQKKEEAEEKEASEAIDTDVDDYCCSCKSYLLSAEEYDRHICDDCWDLMPIEERLAWLQEIKEA